VVKISPIWAEIDDEILHADKFQNTVEVGLRLAETGIEDLGYDEDVVVESKLYYVNTGGVDIPAGLALDQDTFKMYLRDSIAYSEGALESVMHIGKTGLHETVHCLRFKEFPESSPEELEATEVLAYGSEFAHSVMYYGSLQDLDSSHSPDPQRSIRIMQMLLAGTPLGFLLNMSPKELKLYESTR
jgi:hypothetical protein